MYHGHVSSRFSHHWFVLWSLLPPQTVLATDIADKELKVLRNTRWDSAFAETEREENPRDTVNRKATIVIEHLIQASDVAHTMQHWYGLVVVQCVCVFIERPLAHGCVFFFPHRHIYRKWNENFFRECYQAYKDGRTATNPATNWYQGELGFFDFYIIPLAKKLKRCGVFGVASDEYLNYAVRNRKEWHDRGQHVVEEMIQAIAPIQPASSSLHTETEAKPLTTTTTNSVLDQAVPEVQTDRTTLGSLSPERATNSTEVFLDEENHV